MFLFLLDLSIPAQQIIYRNAEYLLQLQQIIDGRQSLILLPETDGLAADEKHFSQLSLR